MKIVVSGGTGFLGAPLCGALASNGHEIVILSRHAGESTAPRASDPRSVPWTPDGRAGPWSAHLDGADAVVNLAGESIAARRWSAAQKARIRDSRVLATRSLISAINAVARPPRVLVNGSAVGYYGPSGDAPLTESSPPGTDYLAQACRDWEAEAAQATSAGVRVVTIRTGLVLERDGGALPKMLIPFKVFAGGPTGSGRQYMSWIHRVDWIEMVRWSIGTDTLSGPVNATAPNPATNAEFSATLGRVMGRPSWLPAPAFAIKLALGEMGEMLLLTGQRVIPARALELGFRFRYPDLEEALGVILVN